MSRVSCKGVGYFYPIVFWATAADTDLYLNERERNHIVYFHFPFQLQFNFSSCSCPDITIPFTPTAFNMDVERYADY